MATSWATGFGSRLAPARQTRMQPPQWRRNASSLHGSRRDPAAVGAAAALRAAADVLRLGGAGVFVLRRLCPAGAGGRDLVDLCRAADRRVRLVADRAIRRGVARRP